MRCIDWCGCIIDLESCSQSWRHFENFPGHHCGWIQNEAGHAKHQINKEDEP